MSQWHHTNRWNGTQICKLINKNKKTFWICINHKHHVLVQRWSFREVYLPIAAAKPMFLVDMRYFVDVVTKTTSNLEQNILYGRQLTIYGSALYLWTAPSNLNFRRHTPIMNPYQSVRSPSLKVLNRNKENIYFGDNFFVLILSQV